MRSLDGKRLMGRPAAHQVDRTKPSSAQFVLDDEVIQDGLTDGPRGSWRNIVDICQHKTRGTFWALALLAHTRFRRLELSVALRIGTFHADVSHVTLPAS